jgi:glycosyltransferase involved in cell wall biosynthesis
LVSVVVSTHNRPTRLVALLDSLAAQSLDPAVFEVIVVDDGSDPSTSFVLDEHRARAVYLLRPMRCEVSSGPASGRNHGWRHARAPLVAFTDDDCVADRDWLSAALAVAARHPGAVVQGVTQPDPAASGGDGLRTRSVRVDTLGPQYETCNIFYPRAALEALGGFDESYGLRPAAEDTDLAWRAIAAGHRTVLAPEARVFHAVEHVGVLGALAVATRWSAAMRVFADHPQTRSMLYRGLFWNVWHYLMWRSVVAVAAPPWLRRMLLARHLLALRRRARAAGAGGWAVPFLLVHDLVECWAVARGAVRYRTPVL